MITENPTHLNCPWCPAQAFQVKTMFSSELQGYECPAKHLFLVVSEDARFDFGYNKEEKCV